MIELNQVTLRAGAFAIHDVNLSVNAGEYAVLMGRTGSGKTTILEAICGLRPVTRGTISVGGRDVTQVTASLRGVGYLPQDRALFSTMSVWEHLAFALAIRKRPPAEIESRVAELADLLGIPHLLMRGVTRLSGGEAQRVALGRALSHHPPVLLLDEPLSALDDQTRSEMYTLLKNIQRKTGVTTLHVTHGVEEARTLADRLFMLEDGTIQERAVQGTGARA